MPRYALMMFGLALMMPALIYLVRRYPIRSQRELSYRSVPLKRAFTVRVKYRYVGEMKPIRLNLDE